MTGRGLNATMNAADVLTALSRAEIERKGRWQSFARAFSMVLMTAVVATPVVLVSTGTLGSRGLVPPEVPARLTQLLAVGLILTTAIFGWRCWELIASSRAPRRLRQARNVLLVLVVLGEAGQLAHAIVLWVRTDGAPAYPVALTLPILFYPALAVGVLGLVGLAVLGLVSSPGFWWRHTGGPDGTAAERRPDGLVRWISGAKSRFSGDEVTWWQSVLKPAPVVEDLREPEGTVICCSGGGIRSASFSLGGLQVLQQQGVYDAARAVIGVSGGGYIATAMHVLRWHKTGPDQERWGPLTPAAFASDSPEFSWLRRHTRYLFDSARVATLAALTVLFGMLVNLFWCLAALGALAWWTGWLLSASGGVRDWKLVEATGADYAGEWEFLRWVWLVPLAGFALFAFERVASRAKDLPLALRQLWRSAAVGVLWVGLGVVMLVIVVPSLLAAVHNYATTSGSPWANLAYLVGLVPHEACQLAAGAACGAESFRLDVTQTTAASLVAVVAAVLTVVRAALAKVPKSDGTAATSVLSRLMLTAKRVLLPWTALVVIIVSGVVLFLSWVARFVNRPTTLADWWIIGLALVIAIGLKAGTDANWTSLHRFYSEQLAYAFLQERANGGSQPVRRSADLRFSRSRPPTGCGPELITCASANISDVEYVPADRRCTPFVFDAKRIGLTAQTFPRDARRLESATYEFTAHAWFEDATVDSAMAMSGAAFSPLVGREQRRVAPFRLIMALANARLGVWLPNPLWTDPVLQVRRMIRLRRDRDAAFAWDALAEEDQDYLTGAVLTGADLAWLVRDLQTAGRSVSATLSRANAGRPPVVDRRAVLMGRGFVEGVRWVMNQPGAFRLFKEGIGTTSVMDRRIYITDGGHYDNLGLVEALRRRPETIYVLDASNDATDSFQALGEAVATARIDLGCNLVIDCTSLLTHEGGAADRAWTSGTATFADGSTCTVHFVKAVKTTTMGLDNQVYARKHADFPRSSTSDQFYGEFDLEAYRQLGAAATEALLTELRRPKVRIPGATAVRNGSRPVASRDRV